jgi:hypothetical protein
MNNTELITLLLYLMSAILFVRSGYLLALLIITFNAKSNTTIYDEPINTVNDKLDSQYLDEQLISILQTFCTESTNKCQVALIDSKGRLFTKMGNDDKFFAIVGFIYNNLQKSLSNFLPNEFDEIIFHESIDNKTITKHIVPFIVNDQQFYCIACCENYIYNKEQLKIIINRLSAVLMNN